MARGQRKTIEEKITAKEEIIRALEVRLKKEKDELQEMREERKQKELATLNEFLCEKGLDVDAVRSLVLQSMG